MEIYYHWHPNLLNIGDTLPAGTYGKLIEELDKINNPNKYALEIYFENHRQSFFYNKPSRLKAIFLLNSIEEAIIYKKHNEIYLKADYNRNLYQVKILNNSLPIHHGSTSLFNQYWLQGKPDLAAHLYWTGEKSFLAYENGYKELTPIEILTESDVQIIKIISSFP